ncbi:MAG: hypothetical protein U9P10_01705 [Thermodesulfobacteriota bacterium]|nr:hypothetical protein [Thermodesulfobacteriota bacterium]
MNILIVDDKASIRKEMKKNIKSKGFVVVANEVKELSRQTASATSEIREKLENVTGVSKDAATTAESADRIKKSADTLSALAGQLQEQTHPV